MLVIIPVHPCNFIICIYHKLQSIFSLSQVSALWYIIIQCTAYYMTVPLFEIEISEAQKSLSNTMIA